MNFVLYYSGNIVVIAVVLVLCGVVIIIAAVSLGLVVIMCASKSLADHNCYVHVNVK